MPSFPFSLSLPLLREIVYFIRAATRRVHCNWVNEEDALKKNVEQFIRIFESRKRLSRLISTIASSASEVGTFFNVPFERFEASLVYRFTMHFIYFSRDPRWYIGHATSSCFVHDHPISVNLISRSIVFLHRSFEREKEYSSATIAIEKVYFFLFVDENETQPIRSPENRIRNGARRRFIHPRTPPH